MHDCQLNEEALSYGVRPMSLNDGMLMTSDGTRPAKSTRRSARKADYTRNGPERFGWEKEKGQSLLKSCGSDALNVLNDVF
jgi:hypothetical protein